MDPLQALRQRLEEITQANQQLITIADAEERPLSEDEEQAFESNTTEFERVTVDLNRRERLAQQSSQLNGNGRRTDPQLPVPAERRSASQNGRDNGNGRVYPAAASAGGRAAGAGFSSFGDFLLKVKDAAHNPSNIDQRLRARMDITNTYSNETTGADGGFAVPPDFRQTIIEKITGEDSLLGRTDVIQTATNNITMPVDETEPWNDTAGIFCRWENEGGAKPESKIELNQRTTRLNKLVALIPVSDELLEDAPAIEGYIRRKAPEKIQFKVNRAIIDGTGAGQPLGFLRSGAKIAVDAGDAPAGSVQFKHIVDMYTRMYAPMRSRAVWLVNPEVEGQLMTMFFAPTTVDAAGIPPSPFPVYLPNMSVAGAPYGTLFGRPVIPTQAMNPLGQEGDIAFVDLSQYLSLIKTGGIKTDVSIHVYFVQDLTAFRFVLRIGGMPWWNTPISPRIGTFTQSPFVTLEAR
jgi:HK97 family phage major capsid protein